MKPDWQTPDAQFFWGDALAVLPELEPNSADSVITDPPYGLSFMGKEWDHGVPGVPFWEAALRVAKPGAMLLAFGGTRTYHRLACAIEDAGWEIRDCLMWLYGTGFPKSLDISKAIDKAAGAEREVIGRRTDRAATPKTDIRGGRFIGGENGAIDCSAITAPATDSAKLWQGWGSSLKPAWEPILLAMKPLDGTFAENAQAHGVAGLNVDRCRIAGDEDGSRNRPPSRLGSAMTYAQDEWTRNAIVQRQDTTGKDRWPANLILDEEAGALLDEMSGVSFSKAAHRGLQGRHDAGTNLNRNLKPATDTVRGHTDTGGASRFFYCAKASRRERGEGNKHPTVKPLALMEWLCNLTRTPTGGVVLDPFIGSGTTAVACRNTGRKCIGIEKDRESFDTAVGRNSELNRYPLLERQPEQGTLQFAG